MIGLPTGTQIWVAAGVMDLRRGFTGLSAQVQTVLKESPFSGHVFVFRGRRGDLIKMLWSDSCCVPNYVELNHGGVLPRDRDRINST